MVDGAASLKQELGYWSIQGHENRKEKTTEETNAPVLGEA